MPRRAAAFVTACWKDALVSTDNTGTQPQLGCLQPRKAKVNIPPCPAAGLKSGASASSLASRKFRLALRGTGQQQSPSLDLQEQSKCSAKSKIQNQDLAHANLGYPDPTAASPELSTMAPGRQGGSSCHHLHPSLVGQGGTGQLRATCPSKKVPSCLLLPAPGNVARAEAV